MTSYNYDRYLAASIESVLNQSFADLELVIVDDGSRDGSREIIERYAREDARVKPIFHPSNRGITWSVNEGIEASIGKFIAFIDSDDLWVTDKLKKQIAVLRENEDLVVWTDAEVINKNGEPAGKTFTRLHRATGKRKTGRIFTELVKGNFILTSSLILKKANLQGIRFGVGIKHFPDYTFFLDLSWRYDFHFIDECLTKYRIHGGNITLKSQDVWNSDMISINDYILSKYGAGLDRGLLSGLLCRTGLFCWRSGRYRDSLRHLYRGIKAYPLNAYYLLLLPVSALKYRLHNTFAARWNTYRRLADAS
jgi:glycosyltransferase involved in cell wall biosynthesis